MDQKNGHKEQTPLTKIVSKSMIHSVQCVCESAFSFSDKKVTKKWNLYGPSVQNVSALPHVVVCLKKANLCNVAFTHMIYIWRERLKH